MVSERVVYKFAVGIGNYKREVGKYENFLIAFVHRFFEPLNLLLVKIGSIPRHLMIRVRLLGVVHRRVENDSEVFARVKRIISVRHAENFVIIMLVRACVVVAYRRVEFTSRRFENIGNLAEQFELGLIFGVPVRRVAEINDKAVVFILALKRLF